MGQYHQFMNFDKKEILVPSSLRKLMEWSYQKNDLVLSVEELMKDRWKGDRVLVIGDYVDEFYENEKSSEILNAIRKENSKEDEENIYFYKYKELKPKSYSDNHIASRYIYNHNKNQYIDLKKQPVQWLVYEQKNNCVYGAKIHPLSLLLSCCNGAGGGDYWGKNEDYVGEWINDSSSLEFSSKPLSLEYEELNIVFDLEKGNDDNLSRIVDYMLEMKEIKSMDEERLNSIKFDKSFYLTNEEKNKILLLFKEKNKLNDLEKENNNEDMELEI